MKFVPLSEIQQEKQGAGGGFKFVPLAAEPKAEPIPEDEYADPMGSGLGAAIKSVAAPREPKTYTGSVFDTQPFNPPFDPAEAARLSRRAYAEETTKPPRRAPPNMTASPEYVGRDRTVGETAVDLTAAVSKGTTGFFKGILNNLPGDPGTELFGGMEQRADRLTSPITKGSEIARQGKIARAQELEGEVGAARATFQTMFTPAGVQVIAQGGGSLIPSIGMSLAGLSAKAVAAANMLSNAGDAAVQSAEQLKKIAPEQWSQNEVYLSLREQGLSHRDAVNMLAPIYAIPAQATGAATGYLSGRTGLEKALVGGAAKGVGAAVGRFGAELGGEQLESLAPQFVGNLVASTLDNKIIPTKGLGQAAVETAFGSLPGASLAALPSSSERLDMLNKYAQKNGFTDVQDMIRKAVPTLGQKAVEDQLIDALDEEAGKLDKAADEQEKADKVRRALRMTDDDPGKKLDQLLDERDADRAEVEREKRLEEEEARNAPPVAETPYEGPEVPDVFGPTPSTTETPVVTTAPDAVPVLIGLQDAAYQNKTPKDAELGKWLASNGLIATQKGKTNITPLGQKLLDQLNPTGIGAQSLTTEEANSRVKEFTHFNRPTKKEEAPTPTPAPATTVTEQPTAAATPITFVKEKRTKDEFGNSATDVELSDGNKHKIQRLTSAESMGLPGWHDTSASPTTGSYLGNTKAEAVKELLRRAEELRQPRSTTPTTSTEDLWAEPPDVAVPEAIEPTTPEDATDSVTPKPEVDAPYYGTDEVNVLGDRVKKTAEKIASDFMVGDDVRVGNIPGTVVGLEGDYVKVRPDNAVSPKAYQRVPKRNVTFISRPNTVPTSAASKSADQDKKFGSEQGKLNADMGGLIQLLGANMYAASIAEVTVKELIQNAFDAVKGAVSDKKAPSLYKTGEITISFDRDKRTITIADNARGMTPEIVRDAFFTVAGSDKSDLDPSERSGGLGLAKMGFMLGAERLTLDTVRDGVRVRVDTSAKDIADSKFQIVKTPAPKGEHGTSVTVKIPEFYVDPKTGEQKTIYYSDNASFYEALSKPLIGPVQVTVKKSGFISDKSETMPVGVNFPEHEFQQFKVNFGWGSADVYFGKTRKEGRYNINHQVLSSGVYQFDTEFALSQSEKIPFDIIVNVKPNVEAKHPDYPFENSRERFKGRLKEDIDSLSAYLKQIAMGHEAADLKENFKNIVSMPRVDLGSDVAEASKKLHKSFDKRSARESTGELPPLPREVRIEGTRVIATDTGKTVADRAKKNEKQTKGTFAAETAAPTRNEFMTKMDQDPSLPIYHNNTNVDLLEVGRQYGSPEVFFAELGTLLVEMKEALANSGIWGYDVLKPENLFFAGISVDKKYGGVHIKVPYKAVMLNPFYSFGARTLFGVRQQLLNTMIHEIAHTGDMDHGVGHNTQMIKVEQFLADQGLYDYFRDAILDVLTRHESAFTAMREAYGQSTTQNTAKSLEDYGSKSASASNGGDGDGSSYELGSVPARGGQGGDGDLRAAAPVNPLVGVRRATAPDGGTAATGIKGKNSLHPSVADAIDNNDVTGALRALAQNTSGLFSDLATRLAELNLPSSIGFKRGRDLVRRAIDHKTSQQQTRLFAYIDRMYPNLYNQYFQNYDRSENLEKVAEGLREFDKAKYNKGPINTEYADVAYVFNKTMPGLTAPGAFYPMFDAIDLNPHPQFGTSNRVFLHEVVHAATEYLLFGGAPLTDRQQAAVAALYEMYDYAQTKLPPGDYGFTNISEFIAEAMTNKAFQDKLKTVSYKPKDQQPTTIFNSLVRTIMRLFGKDNLATAAMTEANELFSAYRPQNIVNIGPRFSKRVRGPISKPDTWRTAESVQEDISDVVVSAATGRMSIADAIKDISGSMWNASGWAVRAAMLPILPLRVMKDLTRTKFPQITGAVDIVEKMTTYRGNKLKIAENIVQEWGPLQGQFPKQSALMSRVMIEATIRGRDPADGVPAGAAPDALDKAWDALRPEFKQLYHKTRDFYANSVNEMVREMKKRAMGLPKAERQAMIRKINDQFGPGKLVAPYFPLRRFGDFWMQVGKGNFKEFYSFESPVSRFLAFQKRKRALSNGNAQQQALVDTMRMGNGISELYGQNVATTQVLRDTQELINGLTSTNAQDLKKELNDSLNQLIYLLLPQQSMRKMFINRRAIQGASGDMLRVFAHTAVHSAYQQARFKYAEQFVNNINNAKDYIDEFANPERAAIYRDYVHELEKRTATVLGVEDKSPMAQFVGGVTSTTFFFMLTAPASAILNIIGASTVTMPYIGARYGYDKTNALMLKNLAKYAGSTPKRSLLPLVTGQFSQTSFPSIVEGGQLPPLLQRAADRFVADGDINISMTNDIFDLGDRPSDLYTGRTNAVKQTLAALFHQAERLNREVSLMTTFELAYEKYNGADKKDLRGIVERDANGKPAKYTADEAFEIAVGEARDIAGLTLGDFSRQMKGRAFTVPAINLLTQFKQYAITATYAILRNFYFAVGAPFNKSEITELRAQMVKDKLPQNVIDQRIQEADQMRREIYREGRRRLAGILGMTFMYGGIAAMPFFSLGLGTLIKAAFSGDDDDDEFFDWENWFYNYMVNEVGGATGAMLAKMGMSEKGAKELGEKTGAAMARGPVSAITGASLSDRVSLDLKNLWYREGKYSPDMRESVQEEIIANMGPSAGLGMNMAGAWQLASQGQYARAFEAGMPSVVAKPVTAYRLGTEGATTRDGVVIGNLYPEQFTLWEISMQAIGFQPEKLAIAQKRAIQAKTYEQKVLDRKAALMNRIWLERDSADGLENALDKAREFSIKYPEVAITPDSIAKSFENRNEAKAKAEAIGAKLDEKLLTRTGPMINR